MKTRSTLHSAKVTPSQRVKPSRSFFFNDILMAFAAAIVWTHNVAAQPATFTYQGRLDHAGEPYTGSAELIFTLWDSSTNGTQIAATSPTSTIVDVTNGLLAAEVDFGSAAFDGSDRWLQIQVRTSIEPYSTLWPRQPITSAPYAVRAGSLSGPVQSASLTGAYSNAVDFNNVANTFTGTFSGNGADLTGVNAATVGGLSAGQFWQLGGNAGTSPGMDFIGTSDAQPFEMKVSGDRVFRLEPADEVPNIIGGSRSNNVTPGVKGATIAGGGLPLFPNAAMADFAAIGGGTFHAVTGPWGTIAGGRDNRVRSESGTVAGGRGNSVSSNATYATIGGGVFNVIGTNSISAVIGGGTQNTISNDANASVISGGSNNRIGENSLLSAVVGGSGNEMHSGVSRAFMGGGSGNIISNNSAYTVLAGGLLNQIDTNSSYATIGGGKFNHARAEETTVAGGAFNEALAFSATVGGGGGHRVEGTWSVIAGGRDNRIETNSSYATVAGGFVNQIAGSSIGGTIGGGIENQVGASAVYSTVAGGSQNRIGTGAGMGTIGGGWLNQIAHDSLISTIAGGIANYINAGYASIGGGSYNTNTGMFAVIPGGERNYAAGQHSFAAGFRARALHSGSFVWADHTDADFSSTATNQFAIRAGNGVMIQSTNIALDLRGGGAVRVQGAGVGTQTPVFIHRATAGNIANHVTTIDHPLCNGDPNAILIITQNWNPGGVGGTYNAHPIGLYYTGNRWNIFNQDGASMPLNAAFNVLVVKP